MGSGRALGSIGAYWRVVRLPIAVTIFLTMLIAAIALYYEEDKGTLNALASAVWIAVPFYVGLRLARGGAGPLHAVIAGALYGLIAEAAYYSVVLAGSSMGFFGVALELGLLDYGKLATVIGAYVAIGTVRSAALAALGLLSGIFIAKMREA